MTESRSALIVASRRYRDPKLRQLRSPTHDAKALASVLGDPKIGAFDVDVSLDEPEHTVRRKLAGFFKTRGRDDLLLLHFSCHGVKDEDGNLYFATPDTELEHLDATAVPAEFVNRLMNRSPSRRIVLLLDCCYAGAFGKGALHRAGAGVELKERFDGRGRVVLTASNSMEYAFEGDTLTGKGTPSVFTSALVTGLRTGEADTDHDGLVSIDELYDYLYDRVREETPNQTPSKWAYDLQGDLVVARNPEGAVVTPAALPDALVHALESPISHVREGSVQALAELLQGHDESLALAARLALESLKDDDSRRVSLAAEATLTRADAASAPAPQPAAATPLEPPIPVDEKPPRVSTRPRLPQPAEPTPTARPEPKPGVRPTPALAAAVAGGLLLLVAAASIVFEGNSAASAQWLMLAPVVVGLLAPLAAVAAARRWVPHALGTGLLLGLALYTSAAAIGWVGGEPGVAGLLSDKDFEDILPTLLRVSYALAAVVLVTAALLAAASLGFRRLLESERSARLHALVALAGAGMCLAALFLPFRNESGDRHQILSEGTVTSPWVAFEPVGALAAVALVAAAGLLGRGHGLLRAGALLALGVGLLAYFVSYIVSVHYHAPGAYGPGGLIGSFGAIAIVAAALQLRSELGRRAAAA